MAKKTKENKSSDYAMPTSALTQNTGMTLGNTTGLKPTVLNTPGNFADLTPLDLAAALGRAKLDKPITTGGGGGGISTETMNREDYQASKEALAAEQGGIWESEKRRLAMGMEPTGTVGGGVINRGYPTEQQTQQTPKTPYIGLPLNQRVKAEGQKLQAEEVALKERGTSAAATLSNYQEPLAAKPGDVESELAGGAGITALTGIGGAGIGAGAVAGALALGLPTLGIGAIPGALIGAGTALLASSIGLMGKVDREQVSKAGQRFENAKSAITGLQRALNMGASPEEVAITYNMAIEEMELAESHLKWETRNDLIKFTSGGDKKLEEIRMWRTMILPLVQQRITASLMNPKKQAIIYSDGTEEY